AAHLAPQVAEDPAATGGEKINRSGSDVKVLAIAEREGGNYSRGTAEDIVAGRDPFDRYLYIYVRRAPGEPFDPFVKEYLRLVFSKEGQQAIATEGLGYLPLNAQEVAQETAKLEPRAVTPPKDAPHASSDGAIHIVGDDGMEGMLTGFNELFRKTHPGSMIEM